VYTLCVYMYVYIYIYIHIHIHIHIHTQSCSNVYIDLEESAKCFNKIRGIIKMAITKQKQKHCLSR